MSYAWYKRHTQDALDGMICLTLEERGAYNTILDLMYQRAGSVPDDARWLAGWMKCSLRKWASLRASLIAKGKLFEVDLNGVPSLANKRVTQEIGGSTVVSGVENDAKPQRNQAETNAKPQRNANENAPDINKNRDLQALDIEEERDKKRKRESARDKSPASKLCPREWVPKDHHIDQAQADGLTRPEIEREALKFRNHERKSAVTNWDRAFTNWLVKAVEFRGGGAKPLRRVGFV